jgi:hypothetical protein
MPWAGWGAGPAGAGASGGPSRWFLGVALVACGVLAGVLLSRGSFGGAAVAAAAAAYFTARLFLGLGRGR